VGRTSFLDWRINQVIMNVVGKSDLVTVSWGARGYFINRWVGVGGVLIVDKKIVSFKFDNLCWLIVG